MRTASSDDRTVNFLAEKVPASHAARDAGSLLDARRSSSTPRRLSGRRAELDEAE
jgi:hypothetical protein